MTSPSAKASYDVLIERTNEIIKDLAELKVGQESLDKSNHEFREAYAGERATVVSKVDAAHIRLNELERGRIKVIEDRLLVLERAIGPLVTWGKIVAFIASAIGLSVIGLIWSILTHQVLLVVP